MPLEVVEKDAGDRRERSKRLSPQEQPLKVKQTTLDQITQTGSSFYSPYTETLSVLRKQNPLLRQVSSI